MDQIDFHFMNNIIMLNYHCVLLKKLDRIQVWTRASKNRGSIYWGVPGDPKYAFWQTFIVDGFLRLKSARRAYSVGIEHLSLKTQV